MKTEKTVNKLMWLANETPIYTLKGILQQLCDDETLEDGDLFVSGQSDGLVIISHVYELMSDEEGDSDAG